MPYSKDHHHRQSTIGLDILGLFHPRHRWNLEDRAVLNEGSDAVLVEKIKKLAEVGNFCWGRSFHYIYGSPFLISPNLGIPLTFYGMAMGMGAPPVWL
jgi:hypothetical protein